MIWLLERAYVGSCRCEDAGIVAACATAHVMQCWRVLDNLRVDLPLGESANLDLHLRLFKYGLECDR